MKQTLWKRTLALLTSLLVLIPSLVVGGPAVLAAEEVYPQSANPSSGMASMDQIIYSANVLDFGADKTGNQDSTWAFQNAINKVNDIRGGTVYVPAGRYKIEGTLNLPSAVSLRGEWINPDEGGLGKGTILMAYAGKGTTNPTENAFIQVHSGATLRDLSIWYPEQNAANPVPYPATIYGHNHSNVLNVTLYNSYYGFYNNTCSSMMIRRLYGTVLYRGVHGAFAYDIPRIENVYFDTKYWANSGLAGAPSGDALTALNTYAENNLIAIQAGEQDWGYWYDINVNHAKYGLYLTAVVDDPGNKVVPGNIAAGKVVTRNTKIGVYLENVGYPGFQLTYADIEATEYGMYYPPKPDYSQYTDNGISVSYYDNATIVVSASKFKGGKAGFWSDKTGGYNINFNDCTFSDWSQYAIRLQDGSLTLSNSTLSTNKTPLSFTGDVDQAVLVGNTFASSTLIAGNGWSNNDKRITRDDDCDEILHTPAYDYTYVSDVKPATSAVFNVQSYGAVVGSTNRVPGQDSTVAFQLALDAAKEAGGGTVYVPAGVYRLNGGVTVPTGVELRGSFEGPHYGNSTNRGTHLYAYGGKNNANGTPLITLEKGAGVKGFSVYYPEQGYSDKGLTEEEKVHAYPPTVRANQNTWIQNMAITACYTAIDAMSNNCDNIVITDVTGAALYATLELGHGTNGGHVQNLHFNYSGWTQQGAYPTQPTGNKMSADGVTSTNALMEDYTTRVVKGLILGDAKNVNFFSCFNIIVAEQVVLEKDPYTGGDFEGTMWGVAFDAATHGVVGRSGSNAKLEIVASMGVFNRQEGGYNVYTNPGFTGRVSLFNADAWDARSKLVYVAGGTVDLVQYFSWCVHNGVCKKGGTLNVLASSMVSNNGDNSGTTPDYTYESGAMGKAIGNLDCKQKLNLITQSGSFVDKQLNATELVSSSTGNQLTFSGFNDRDRTVDNRGENKGAMDTGWVTYDGGNNNTGVDMSKTNEANVHLQMTVILTKTECTDADSDVFSTGNVQIRSTDGSNGERIRSWSVHGLNLKSGTNYLDLSLADARKGNNDLDLASINRVRIYVDSCNRFSGIFTMQIRDVRVVDVSSTDGDTVLRRSKLGEMINAQLKGDALSDYTATSIAQYNQLFTTANAVYNNSEADSQALVEQILILNEADDLLVKRTPTASAALRDELREMLNGVRSNSDLYNYTVATVKQYKALFTDARAVYNDVDATDAQIKAQIDILKTADDVLEAVEIETIPLFNGEKNSNVAHYMNVFAEYDPVIDLKAYGERVSMDLHFLIRINKDDASFPESVKPYGNNEWINQITNGAVMLWSGGKDNDHRYKLADIKCGQNGNALQYAVVGEYVEVTLPLPADVVTTGQIDKFEIYIYNDLHRFMQNKDPDHKDQYTEANEGSHGVSITVDRAEIILGGVIMANKTALEVALDRAKTVTDTSIYTPSSVAAFQAALEEARRVYDSDDVSQTKVDDTVTALTDAQNSLVRKADKTALKKALDEANELDTTGYGASTVKALTDAINAANTVYGDDEASQTRVDIAVNQLNVAMESFAKAVNRSELQAAIAAAEEVDLSLYTSASRTAFEAALTKANQVNTNKNATQTDVDNAVKALTSAQDALVKLADKAALQTAVAEALKVDTTLYTDDTVAEFVTALSAARKLIIKAEATQTEVDAAIEALDDATKKLVAKPTWTYGDTNNDGDVTAEDALLALQIATDKVAATEVAEKAGNVDGEGGITANDALLILQFSTKKIGYFPAEKK